MSLLPHTCTVVQHFHKCLTMTTEYKTWFDTYPTLCTLYTSLLDSDDTDPCFLSSLAALDWAVSVIVDLSLSEVKKKEIKCWLLLNAYKIFIK